VYLETITGRLNPMPDTFLPRGAGGEVIVIVVRRPKNALTEVTFENQSGGKVEGTFADGTKRTLTTVIKARSGHGAL
jgi:hypothetical protein